MYHPTPLLFPPLNAPSEAETSSEGIPAGEWRLLLRPDGAPEWQRVLFDRHTALETIAELADLLYGVASRPRDPQALIAVPLGDLAEAVRRLAVLRNSKGTRLARANSQQLSELARTLLAAARTEAAVSDTSIVGSSNSHYTDDRTDAPSKPPRFVRSWTERPASEFVKPLPTWWIAGGVAQAVAVRAAAPLLGFSTRTIATPAGQWFCYVAGAEDASAPILLLLHGLFTTSVSMLPLALLLGSSGRHRVIVPDLIDFDFGFSRSSRAVGGGGAGEMLKMAEYPSAVIELIEALLAEQRRAAPAVASAATFGPAAAATAASSYSTAATASTAATSSTHPTTAVGSRVSLIGHSFGGFIAHRIAETRPDLVRRAVLLCPGGLGRYRIIPSAAPLAGLSATRTLIPSHVHSAVGEVVARVFQLIARSPWTVHLLSGLDFEEYFSPPASARAVACPTLLLWGTADSLHRTMPGRPGSAMLYGLARGLGYWLVGADHALPLDSVVAVERLAAQFLECADEEVAANIAAGQLRTTCSGDDDYSAAAASAAAASAARVPWRLRTAAGALRRVAAGTDRLALPMTPQKYSDTTAASGASADTDTVKSTATGTAAESASASLQSSVRTGEFTDDVELQQLQQQRFHGYSVEQQLARPKL